MVYHREDELDAAPLSPADAAEDDTVAGMVVDRRVGGLLPRTEVPKSAVTGEASDNPAYAWSMESRQQRCQLGNWIRRLRLRRPHRSRESRMLGSEGVFTATFNSDDDTVSLGSRATALGREVAS